MLEEVVDPDDCAPSAIPQMADAGIPCVTVFRVRVIGEYNLGRLREENTVMGERKVARRLDGNPEFVNRIPVLVESPPPECCGIGRPNLFISLTIDYR